MHSGQKGSRPKYPLRASRLSTLLRRCCRYGHTARVSSAAVLHPAGFSAAAVQRLGVVTGSHDQTIRCEGQQMVLQR